MMTLMPPQRKGGAADGMGGADDNNDKTRQRRRGDEAIQHKADAGEALKDGKIAEGRQGRRLQWRRELITEKDEMDEG